MRFITAQKFFSVFFVIAIFAASAVNMYVQRDKFKYDLAQLTLPDSEDSARVAFKAIQGSVNSNITGKFRFLDMHAYLQALMGKNEISDFKYIRSISGALNFGNMFPVDTSLLPEFAERVHRFKQLVSEQGNRFLFLNPPDLVIRGGTRYVRGMPYQDFNVCQDILLDRLREYDVDCLDLRDSLAKSGIGPEDMLFKTDHHWTIETCFQAFINLVDKLEEDKPGTLDPDGYYRDRNNYNSRTYPSSSLGSTGRGAGMAFSGLDDYTIIWPKFKREYHVDKVDQWAGPHSIKGDTEKALLHNAALESDEPYLMLTYNFYLGGLVSWAKILNLDNPDGPKLLMVNDSFGIPLATFLAPMFSEVQLIWPLAENYRKEVEPYVRENHFDYVIVELIPSNFIDEGFNFFREKNQTPKNKVIGIEEIE